MHPALTVFPAFHLRLRRLRRSRALKQAYVAAVLGVDQSTVSRWESGALVPEQSVIERTLRLLSGTPADDCALCRLVGSSSLPLHLVTDADHRLLAASPVRQRQWRKAASELMGSSLWRFATPEIEAAESQLAESRWWEDTAPAPVRLRTRAALNDGLYLVGGEMIWERVWLASGEPARLCTSLDPSY